MYKTLTPKDIAEAKLVAPGVRIAQDGRYIPFPEKPDLWVNPPDRNIRQPEKGDAFSLRAFFGLGGAAAPFGSIDMHYIVTSAGGTSPFLDVAEAMAKAFVEYFKTPSSGTGMQAGIAQNIQFGNPEVRWMQQPNNHAHFPFEQIGKNTSPTDSTPYRTAPILHKVTAKRGRSFDGRSFLMPPADQAQNGGSFTSTAHGYFNNTAKDWREFAVTIATKGYTFTLGVYSRKISKQSSAVVVTP